MPRVARAEGPSKPRRRRASQRERGMKLIQMWVPDPHAPGFRDEARRQSMLLRGAPEEEEALRFIEAAADWTEADRTVAGP